MGSENPTPKVFLTPRELAARWLVPPTALRYWRLKGIELSYYKIETKILYKVSEIEAFEKSPAYQVVADYQLRRKKLKKDSSSPMDKLIG
jgi:hypothetical protein